MKNSYQSQREETIIAQKNSAKKTLITTYKLPKSTKYIGCIDLTDVKTREFIIQWLVDIGVSIFVIGKTAVESDYIRVVKDFSDTLLSGCDFLVSDTQTNPSRITACILAGIVPIVPKNTPFKNMFSQFNPMEFTGNSYIYEGGQYQIFASTVALLENMKFPADREILLKNVVKTL